MERRILSHKFKEFQTLELLVNKGLETSSLTESFLTFLKEIEGTTVQFYSAGIAFNGRCLFH